MLRHQVDQLDHCVGGGERGGSGGHMRVYVCVGHMHAGIQVSVSV